MSVLSSTLAESFSLPQKNMHVVAQVPMLQETLAPAPVTRAVTVATAPVTPAVPVSPAVIVPHTPTTISAVAPSETQGAAWANNSDKGG